MKFQQAILDWYKKHKRDLPWRKTTDLYKILVSEVMLQQTQVDRVIPKYEAFLKKFPIAHALAHSSPAEVLELWSGLGYNRRAINLQRAAVQLCKTIPENLTELHDVGPYTASALECFALGKDVAVIDTNIRRIFSRVFFKGSGTQKEIDKKVALEIPTGQGIAWTNALMDFGSLVCTASGPQCGKCPIRENCSAWKAGTPNNYFQVTPPQKPFKNSRRFYRGQVLKILGREKIVSQERLAQLLKKEKNWVEELVKELEKEGLVSQENVMVKLPTHISL